MEKEESVFQKVGNLLPGKSGESGKDPTPKGSKKNSKVGTPKKNLEQEETIENSLMKTTKLLEGVVDKLDKMGSKLDAYTTLGSILQQGGTIRQSRPPSRTNSRPNSRPNSRSRTTSILKNSKNHYEEELVDEEEERLPTAFATLLRKEIDQGIERAGMQPLSKRKPKISFPKFKPGNDCKMEKIKEYVKMLGYIPKLEKATNAQDYLDSINGYVTNYDLTWPEYRQIIATKLPENLRLTFMKMTMDEAMDLLAIFGQYGVKEELRADIRELIFKKFSNTADIIDRTFPLLYRLDESPETKLGYLYDIVKENVPAYLAEQLKMVATGSGKSMASILEFLNSYRKNIDAYLYKNKKDKFDKPNFGKVLKETYNYNVENKTRGAAWKTDKNTRCYGCDKPGHIKPDCPVLQKKYCAKCKRIGHMVEECRMRCRLCFSQTHLSEACGKYPGIEPVAARCDQCYREFKLTLYHPEKSCRQQIFMTSYREE